MILVRRVAQWILCASCVFFGALLAWRALWGPFDSPVHVNSPLNVESLFGLSAILLLLVRADSSVPERPDRRGSDLLALVSITAIVVVSFWRTAGFYFLSDDFIQLKYALRPMYHLLTMAGGDGFYRPLSNASMRLTGAGAGSNPIYWHSAAIALHAVNSMLVFWLASVLRLSRAAAWFAAALFALHASHPEAVVWIAARYDLLATLFVLLCLVLFVRSWDVAGGRALLYRSVSLVAMAAAFLSKESSYTVPLLLLLFVAWKGELRFRRSWYALLPFLGITAAMLAWRWFLFGGIGGYLTPSGQPDMLSLGIVSTLKALVLRLWAILFFPINWSNEPGLLLGVLLVLYLAALVWLCRTPASLRALALPLGFLIALAVPPLPQLLIGADLQKARVLYLPSVAFCLLLATLAENVKGKLAVSVTILVFQGAALVHNLAAWEYASQKANQACSVAAGCVKARDGRIAAFGLPQSLRGAYFFANGFPECVELQSGAGAAKVDLMPPGSSVDAAQYSCVVDWDGSKDELTVR
ncbi:MAG TPA: hypothetical protein VGV35_07305 [Bryobacteraceae bacterium]|nr:hypothetical protein [Bryobacteraceae bacterium]